VNRVRRHDDGVTAGGFEGVEIVRGGAAPDEVAAVVAVLSALGEREGQPKRGRTRLAALARTGDTGRPIDR
jgi:hypothetical protein